MTQIARAHEGPAGGLTDAAIRSINTPGRYSDGARGLLLSVTPKKTGGLALSWLCRYSAPDGRRREAGIGRYPEVSLAEARAKARALRAKVEEGTDPLAVKHERREQLRRAAAEEAARAVTFQRCADDHIAASRRAWRNDKHAAQWESSLKRYVLPWIGDVPVAEITRPTLLAILQRDSLWATKRETARRVRGRIFCVMERAIELELHPGPNPTPAVKQLDKLNPTSRAQRRHKHHAALPFDEIGPFMRELRAHSGLGAAALEFTILTATRTGDVIGATWREIDLDRAVWCIPADRMKSEREHRVPLSSSALALLHRIAPPSPLEPADFVFRHAGFRNRGISNMAMLTALQKGLGRPALTVHGFRSTFRDWTAERTTFSNEVAEMALAHAIADKTEAAYRRGDLFDKRRDLMEAWAQYIERETARENDAVIPIAPATAGRV